MKIFVCTLVMRFMSEEAMAFTWSAAGNDMDTSFHGAMQQLAMSEDIMLQMIGESCKNEHDLNSKLVYIFNCTDPYEALTHLQTIKGLQVTEHYVCV